MYGENISPGGIFDNDKYMNEAENIKTKLYLYSPNKIILFGSLAKGVINKNSDIDICIVKDTENKRELITDIYMNVNSSYPFDVIVYTYQEWEENVKGRTSFAYSIYKEGRLLYG